MISDVEAVAEIFSLKSEQEEVSDFSFSFGQTDLCEGLIAWMSHDTDSRKQHIHLLRQYVCLHQAGCFILIYWQSHSYCLYMYIGLCLHKEEVL